MARKPRKKRESQKYHVILRGNNRQNIFFNDEDRYFILNRIKKYAEHTENVSVNSSLKNYSTHSPRILKGVISMFHGRSFCQSAWVSA